MSLPRLTIREPEAYSVKGTGRDGSFVGGLGRFLLVLAPLGGAVGALSLLTQVAPLGPLPEWSLPVVALSSPVAFLVVQVLISKLTTDVRWSLRSDGTLRFASRWLSTFGGGAPTFDLAGEQGLPDELPVPVTVQVTLLKTLHRWVGGLLVDPPVERVHERTEMDRRTLASVNELVRSVPIRGRQREVRDGMLGPWRVARVMLREPWPTLRIEWMSASTKASELAQSVIVSMHPFGEPLATRQVVSSDDREKPGLMERLYAERLFERIAQVAREPRDATSPKWRQMAEKDLEVIDGWATTPHASWTIVDGFPRDDAGLDGPFRSRATGGDEWEWSATGDVAAMSEVLVRDSAESWPTRIVVRGDTLYATEPGTTLVGSLPLETLGQVTDRTPRFDRFRFGRATDVILPKDSDAAMRLRKRLSAGDGRTGDAGAAHDV
jgi:hypothetical protein